MAESVESHNLGGVPQVLIQLFNTDAGDSQAEKYYEPVKVMLAFFVYF